VLSAVQSAVPGELPTSVEDQPWQTSRVRSSKFGPASKVTWYPRASSAVAGGRNRRMLWTCEWHADHRERAPAPRTTGHWTSGPLHTGVACCCMGELCYPNDKAIVSHICDRLEQMQLWPTAPPSLPPSRDQVVQMLAAAFAASLESEEGRPVTFTMFFGPNNLPINYRFRESAPLSTGTLVRLSAGLDHSRSNIAICAESQGLRIVGVWHLGAGEVGLFSIQVVGPGVFVVKYSARLILTYRRGQYVPYPGTHDSVNEAGKLFSEPSARYSRRSREAHAVRCRFRVAEEMLRIGHGGTLLVAPYDLERGQEVASHRFPPAAPQERVREAEENAYDMWMRRQAAFQVLSGRRLKNCTLRANTRVTLAGHLLGGHASRERLAAELDALARLTATDGMVVILPDLIVLGFGVFVEVKDPECTIELHDPYEAAPRTMSALSHLGGARHQSAAVATARLPGALAIVVSADRTVTAMRRADDGAPLVVHTHLELRMPPWPVYQ
jgi:hypothetical protein